MGIEGMDEGGAEAGLGKEEEGLSDRQSLNDETGQMIFPNRGARKSSCTTADWIKILIRIR